MVEFQVLSPFVTGDAGNHLSDVVRTAKNGRVCGEQENEWSGVRMYNRGCCEGEVVDVSQGKMNGECVEFANVSKEPEPTLARKLS